MRKRDGENGKRGFVFRKGIGKMAEGLGIQESDGKIAKGVG